MRASPERRRASLKKGGPMIWLTKTTTTTRSAIIDMYAYTPASSSGSPTEALNVCLYSSLTWLGLGLGLGLGFGFRLGLGLGLVLGLGLGLVLYCSLTSWAKPSATPACVT